MTSTSIIDNNSWNFLGTIFASRTFSRWNRDLWLVDATAGNIVITLPAAPDVNTNKIDSGSFAFRRIDSSSNTVTFIAGAPSGNITFKPKSNTDLQVFTSVLNPTGSGYVYAHILTEEASVPFGVVSTILTMAATSGDTTLTVNSTVGFPTTGILLIDSEVIQYTNITSTAFTGVTRAINSTTAVNHLVGATVSLSSAAISSSPITAVPSAFVGGSNVVPAYNEVVTPNYETVHINNIKANTFKNAGDHVIAEYWFLCPPDGFTFDFSVRYMGYHAPTPAPSLPNDVLVKCVMKITYIATGNCQISAELFVVKTDGTQSWLSLGTSENVPINFTYDTQIFGYMTSDGLEGMKCIESNWKFYPAAGAIGYYQGDGDTINIDSPTAQIKSLLPPVHSKLTSAINSTDIGVPIVSTEGFPDVGYIRIDSEVIQYNTVIPLSNLLSDCTRKKFGTTATSHAINAPVTLVSSVGSLPITYPIDKVVITNGLGVLDTSSVSSTTLTYLDITSSLNTLLNAKLSTTGGALSGAITTRGTAPYLRPTNTNYTLVNNIDGVIVDASSGVLNITLPDLTGGGATPTFARYFIIKSDASVNAVNIIPFAGQTVGLATSDSVTQVSNWVELFADPNNLNWTVVRSYGAASNAIQVTNVVTAATPVIDGTYAFNVAGTGAASFVVVGDIAKLTSGTWTVLYPAATKGIISVYNLTTTDVWNRADYGWYEVLGGSKLQNYVQNIAFAIATLPPVAVASTTNIATLSGLSAIDGYTPIAGDIILVKDQTLKYSNGIYLASASAWVRYKYSSGTNTWVALTGGDLTYDSLNIDNGVVYVNNGTTNKNSQFQCSVVNKTLAFSDTTVQVNFVSRRVSPNRDIKNSYVSSNIGNNTQNNGTMAYPYATISQALVGASFPHVMTMAIGADYTESLTLSSGQSNLLIQTTDTSKKGGKVIIAGNHTLQTGNTRVSFKDLVLNGGNGLCVTMGTGNLGRHEFENITFQTTNANFLAINTDLPNWISFRNCGFSIGAGDLVLPAFTGTPTINIYDQQERFPIIGVGSSGLTINIFNDTLTVRIFRSVRGTFNWMGQAFDYAINGFITSYAQLMTLTNYITDYANDGFWLLQNVTAPVITPSATSGTGTLTTYTIPNVGYVPVSLGDWVTASGFTPSAYNGTFQVTAASATSLTVSSTASGAVTVQGTITPLSFVNGSIIGKQTAPSILTEMWLVRTYAQAPATLRNLTSQTIIKSPINTWSLLENQLTATLTNAMTTFDVSESVNSTTGFPSSGILYIDNEAIGYANKTSTSFTGLVRALNGTVAATHAVGAVVSLQSSSVSASGVLASTGIIWTFDANDWSVGTIALTGLYPSANFVSGTSALSINVSTDTDGLTSGQVTSASGVAAGNAIRGAIKTLTDDYKSISRLPVLKLLASTNLPLTGSTTDALAVGFLCYGASGAYLGFVSATKSVFTFPASPNLIDAILDTVQFISGTLTFAPIVYFANATASPTSFRIKYMGVSKDLPATGTYITDGKDIGAVSIYGDVSKPIISSYDSWTTIVKDVGDECFVDMRVSRILGSAGSGNYSILAGSVCPYIDNTKYPTPTNGEDESCVVGVWSISDPTNSVHSIDGKVYYFSNSGKLYFRTSGANTQGSSNYLSSNWLSSTYFNFSPSAPNYRSFSFSLKFKTTKSCNVLSSSSSVLNPVFADYTMPNGTAVTSNVAMNFSTKIADSGGFVTTGVNWKFTNTTGTKLNLLVVLSGIQASSGASLRVALNGVTAGVTQYFMTTTTNVSSGSVVIQLNPNDYFFIFSDGNYTSSNINRIQCILIGNNQVVNTEPTYFCRYTSTNSPATTVAPSLMKFNNKVYDNLGMYNPSTGYMIAPVNGLYEMKGIVSQNTTTALYAYLDYLGVPAQAYIGFYFSVGVYPVATFLITMPLLQGQAMGIDIGVGIAGTLTTTSWIEFRRVGNL